MRIKENRVAYQYIRPDYPMPDCCIKLAQSIQLQNEIDSRDKAIIALTFLTGMRPHALVSLPLECIDKEKLVIYQNPGLGVQTKFSKNITSKIFNFDDELINHIIFWINYLEKKGFSPHHPLFPIGKENQTSENLSFQKPIEVSDAFCKTTFYIRKVFQCRAIAAGMKYFSPITFRHTTIYYAMKFVKTGEELKALSQHFGHEDVRTTLSVYGNFEDHRLIEILDQIDFTKKQTDRYGDPQETLKILAKQLGMKY